MFAPTQGFFAVFVEAYGQRRYAVMEALFVHRATRDYQPVDPVTISLPFPHRLPTKYLYDVHLKRQSEQTLH